MPRGLPGLYQMADRKRKRGRIAQKSQEETRHRIRLHRRQHPKGKAPFKQAKEGNELSIDIKRLSPWAQAQIAQKAAAQIREKAERKEEKQRKYNNTPTERITEEGKTIKFDSQKEARRFDELMILLRAGEISDLRLQEDFTLQEAYTLPNGNRVQAIRYRADFTYIQNGEKIVEDVKSKATKTRTYSMKRKLLQERRGITITEVE